MGSGDARNVLFTIFNEPENSKRKLDFTCCDFEGAVLARNILLFSLLADDRGTSSSNWKIYFHLHLDEETHTLLVEQCAKLVQYAESMQTWRQSPYAFFIHIATEQTLNELRRHWNLYVDMLKLPSPTLTRMRNGLKQAFDKTKESGISLSTARSAGPLMAIAVREVSACVNHYRKTGVTFTNPRLIQQAKFMNPTFLYSRAGDDCSVHYGTDPFLPFHLAPIFGNTTAAVKSEDVVKGVQEEFSQWCSAFQKAISPSSPVPPTIRFLWGEATAVSRTLQSFAIARQHSVSMPVSQFSTQVIQLDREEYGDGPVTFNVIDTSNLVDNMGLLNVMVTTSPLLDLSSPSHVLYTESLLFRSKDGTKEFKDRLHTDLTVASLLIGLCPVDYLAGFSSRSNTQEVLLHLITKGESTQFHQMTTWKAPASADAHAVLTNTHQKPVTFDNLQLAKLLWDMYVSLFSQEDAGNFFRANRGEDFLRAVRVSNMLHFSRESFVLFARMVRERNRIPQSDWKAVMTQFVSLQENDRSMPMDKNNTQDLLLHLHRYGVHPFTSDFATPPSQKTGRFSKWKTVPPLVRIILRVPRERLEVLNEMMAQSPTPILHCDLEGKWSHNIYSSIHLAYGQLASSGTDENPTARFDADPQGPQGSMPLAVAFIVPSAALYTIEPPENIKVGLRVRSTPGTVPFISKLGIHMSLFTAKLMDTSNVVVLPETVVPARRFTTHSHHTVPDITSARVSIGPCDPMTVHLDDKCQLVETLVSRVRITNEEAKRKFGEERAIPQITQVSACTMRLNVGELVQDISFNFPVQGSKHRLRLARKSLYIEVVVPVHEPFRPEGMQLNPFPVIWSRIPGGNLNSWSIHHLNLTRLPSLNMRSPASLSKWMYGHAGSMLTQRERSLRAQKSTSDQLMLVKDTLHALIMLATGAQGGGTLDKRQVFKLFDTDSEESDTIIFVNDAKYDLSAHTVVLNAFVYPGTISPTSAHLMPSIGNLFARGNVRQINVRQAEIRAHKQMLPALAERCSTGSWTHGPNCEYQTYGTIPLTTEMEEDPLCSCGRGKDVEPMKRNKLRAPFAPYVTRIAISPLFGVTYLEPLVEGMAA